jgi:hypothetical protein
MALEPGKSAGSPFMKGKIDGDAAAVNVEESMVYKFVGDFVARIE